MQRYTPPEVVRSDWNSTKSGPITAVDAYQFGILLFEVFNGGFASKDELTQPKKIPPSMHQSYKKLLNSSPKARLSIVALLAQGQRIASFFDTPLIHLVGSIESLGLKDDSEREEFIQ
jgi:SCY1-like protein 1